jgi:4-aminobutyrate aminotransferase-like enzyme
MTTHKDSTLENGDDLPLIRSAIPGPRTQNLSERLSRVECGGITFLGDAFPIFWEKALGSNVWDVDGNRYIDLTAAFGVAGCGHSHPELAAVAGAQAVRLMHGMGDVHPPKEKVLFLEHLDAATPGELTGAILGQNGADAVEAALKAAYLHTGRSEIITFGSAYHGLSGMALDVTTFDSFRTPFSPYLGEHVHVLPYPRKLADLKELWEAMESLLESGNVGAVIAEPIQGRGGVVVPPDGFLQGLRRRCDGRETVLILDEIYTGFSRTGRAFASDYEDVVPDLMCLGKALTGGFPLSVCVGLPHVMHSWPKSSGEAIHTSTFLGNPMGCAMGTRSIALHRELNLAERSRVLGARLLNYLKEHLSSCVSVKEVRGRGMMIGVEFAPGEGGASLPAQLMLGALKKGVLVLPSGPGGHVLSLSPPLTISEEQLFYGADVVIEWVREECA